MEKNASGTHRQTLRSSTHGTVQLELQGRTWELDEVEQGALAVFITEMQAARQRPLHEKWCDPAQHRAAADGQPVWETPCVGRMLVVNDDLAGWWHQDDDGGEPRFYVTTTGGSWDPTPQDLETVNRLLSTGAADQLLDLVVLALGQLEHGATAGGRS